MRSRFRGLSAVLLGLALLSGGGLSLSVDALRLQPTDETRDRFDANLEQRYASLRLNIVLAQASDALRAAVRYRQGLDYPVPVYGFDGIADDLVAQNT